MASDFKVRALNTPFLAADLSFNSAGTTRIHRKGTACAAGREIKEWSQRTVEGGCRGTEREREREDESVRRRETARSALDKEGRRSREGFRGRLGPA